MKIPLDFFNINEATFGDDQLLIRECHRMLSMVTITFDVSLFCHILKDFYR